MQQRPGRTQREIENIYRTRKGRYRKFRLFEVPATTPPSVTTSDKTVGEVLQSLLFDRFLPKSQPFVLPTDHPA